MSEGNTATLLAARAIYKKTEGYLYLTDYPFRIVWVHPETGEPLVQLFTQDCTNLFANKTGAKPPKLKIVANDVDYNFVFTGEEPQCFVNRDAFRDQVKILIRESMTQASTAGPSEVATPDQVASPNAMEEDPPEPSTLPPPPAVTIPTVDPAKEQAARMYRLRKRILMRDPELAALHSAVVIAGKMSENDFWASRQHLLDEAAVTDAQKKGKSSRLVDPKPGVSASGDIKISITPQLIQEIFDEWPVVKRVWVENVPNNMTKEEFWKRYFESQLYHNHRASVRSTATQHVIKADPIFDKYLEPVDNELQPRHIRNDAVNRLVDLAATEEDHVETGNIRDVTMQAGKQKASLPLMRKFNEHSERLLNTALGTVQPVRRTKLEHMNEANDYDEIDIEDLHGGGDDPGIPLDMQNRQRYFEGRSGASGSAPTVDNKAAVVNLKGQILNWEHRLKTVQLDGQAGTAAFKAISSNISSRTRIKSSRLNVSPEFLKQMQTLESTTNEYLRQFWFFVYPTPEGVKRPAPEERAQKIGAMRDRLLVNQKRIEDLVNQAAANRWDKNGVSEAFKPTLTAVDKAVKFAAGKR